MADFDPQSYSYQERDLGQVPNYIPISNFKLHGGGGTPAATLGANGDFYFQSGGTQAGNTVIFHKEGGAWVALVTT